MITKFNNLTHEEFLRLALMQSTTEMEHEFCKRLTQVLEENDDLTDKLRVADETLFNAGYTPTESSVQ